MQTVTVTVTRTRATLPVILTTLLILSLTLVSSSCTKTVVTAPIPNQINSFDAWAWRSLYDAQAALNAFRADVTSGKIDETLTLKMIFNTTADDYNAAQTVYKAWHAAGGSGPTAPVSAAVTLVQTDISKIASQAATASPSTSPSPSPSTKGGK
jgi:hypothetical protein